MLNFFLIGFSAAIGAWMRWLIGAGMLAMFPGMPLGSLVVNLLGGFFMGLSIAFLQITTNISDEIRLIINVGFLGGLTTFSAYTADLFEFMQKGELSLALLFMIAHVIGALVLCYAGYYCVSLSLRSF
ncbi:fluoride efflux transporter CrcB [Methylophilaceae bacterium]|jgi:CrcB protein|nr:fluoride efflux transporter CrcB [Methylophilaceae bacterium]